MMHELPVPSKLPICVEVRESFFEKKIEDKKYLRATKHSYDVPMMVETYGTLSFLTQ